MIRAFIAIPLPDDLCIALETLSFQLPLPRRVPRENMHITLTFLGEHPEPILEEVHYALETICLPQFRLCPNGLGHFGKSKPRSVHAELTPEPALDQLQSKVESKVKQAGIALERQKYIPHITLGRFSWGEADLAQLEAALVEQSGFETPPFVVERFVLYQSHLGRGVPHYEELASYMLG